MNSSETMLTIDGLIAKIKLGKTTIYALQKAPCAFPKPKKIAGGKKSVWLESEVDAWLTENMH